MSKYRNGFVSNSSTSSFCIYGCYLGDSDSNPNNWDALIDEISDKIKNTDLEIHHTEYGAFVGREFTTIKDNETGGEFKKGVTDKILEILPDKKKEDVGTVEQAWYNG